MNLILKLTLFFSLLVASGCASTIGNLSGLDTVAFEVGRTQKNDVANALGLPSSRIADSEREYWGYTDSPALASVIYPVPVTGTHATTRTALVNRYGKAGMADAAVIYTFDASGTLIDVLKSSVK